MLNLLNAEIKGRVPKKMEESVTFYALRGGGPRSEVTLLR